MCEQDVFFAPEMLNATEEIASFYGRVKGYEVVDATIRNYVMGLVREEGIPSNEDGEAIIALYIVRDSLRGRTEQ
jgi:hypothetical protein